MSEALREIAALFTVKAEDKELKELHKGIEGASSALLAFGEVVAGAFALGAVKEFVEGQIKMGAEIKDTADRLGVGAEELQKFQFAAEQSGSSAESAANGLKFLNKNLGEARNGNEAAAKTIASLGVATTDAHGQMRPLIDIMGDASDKFASLDNGADQTALAMNLFGRAGADLIPLLKEGRGGLEELYKAADATGGIIGGETLKQMKEAEDATGRWSMTVRGLKVALLADFLPNITEGVDKVSQWVKGFRDLVKDTNIVKELLGALSVVAGIKVAGAFKTVAESLGIIKKGGTLLEILGGMGEFLLIVAGIALVYLIFDDLYNLMNGNESVIGDAMDQFLGAGTAALFAKALNNAWSQVAVTMAGLGVTMGNIDWDKMGEAGKRVFLTWTDLLLQVMNALGAIASITVKTAVLMKDVALGSTKAELVADLNAFKADEAVNALGINPLAIAGTTIHDVATGNPLNYSIPGSAESSDVLRQQSQRTAKSFSRGDSEYGSGVGHRVTVNVSGTDNPREAGRLAAQGTKDALVQADLLNTTTATGGMAQE